jgi:hypothetical protein
MAMTAGASPDTTPAITTNKSAAPSTRASRLKSGRIVAMAVMDAIPRATALNA